MVHFYIKLNKVPKITVRSFENIRVGTGEMFASMCVLCTACLPAQDGPSIKLEIVTAEGESSTFHHLLPGPTSHSIQYEHQACFHQLGKNQMNCLPINYIMALRSVL